MPFVGSGEKYEFYRQESEKILFNSFLLWYLFNTMQFYTFYRQFIRNEKWGFQYKGCEDYVRMKT